MQLLDDSIERNQPAEMNNLTDISQKLMKIKTNIIVGILLVISIVQFFSLISAKVIFNKILVVILNSMLLSVSHLWILRSEAILSYVKRKVKMFYESYSLYF